MILCRASSDAADRRGGPQLDRSIKYQIPEGPRKRACRSVAPLGAQAGIDAWSSAGQGWRPLNDTGDAPRFPGGAAQRASTVIEQHLPYGPIVSNQAASLTLATKIQPIELHLPDGSIQTMQADARVVATSPRPAVNITPQGSNNSLT
jgi:hypothetical protein